MIFVTVRLDVKAIRRQTGLFDAKREERVLVESGLMIPLVVAAGFPVPSHWLNPTRMNTVN